MSASIRRSILVMSLLCLVALPVAAQQQMPKPEFIFLWEGKANPDRVAENEAAMKATVAAATAVKHPYPFNVVFRNDMVIGLGTLLEGGYGDLEDFYAAWDKVFAAMPSDTPQRNEGNLQHWRSSLWMFRPDLSYVPDPLPVDANKHLYRYWQFFYGKPGHEAQVEAIAKKFVAVAEKHKSKLPWWIYQGIIGVDGPVYVIGYAAENAVTFQTVNLENFTEFGEENNKLWAEAFKHARGFESNDGWHRPDLSYTPE